MAAVSAGLIAPFGAPIAYTTPYLAPYNYRGPLSIAPGQPANILGTDGRPLDTLEVNLDRSAHYKTKVLEGLHLLKKRSVVAPLAIPYGSIHTFAAPYHAASYLAHPIAAPIARIAPYATPVAHYW